MSVRSSGNPRASFRDRFLGTGNRASNPFRSIIQATGGTIVDSGGYRIHIFLSPGDFTVSNSSGTVEYLVVAGGGTGGADGGAGAGAGGLRTATGFLVNIGPNPVVVGSGGGPTRGSNGNPSTFSTITSTGGGGGGSYPGISGGNGGSGGGGGGQAGAAGSGNTPPTSPPQGNPGGTGFPSCGGGCPNAGGGGAGGAGAPGGTPPGIPGGDGARGGAGSPISWMPGPGIYPLLPAPVQSTVGTAWRDALGPTGLFAGGGSGNSNNGLNTPGGPGGGGAGGFRVSGSATPGIVNTGGGGGGCDYGGTQGTGGSGIVVIRYLI